MKFIDSVVNFGLLTGSNAKGVKGLFPYHSLVSDVVLHKCSCKLSTMTRIFLVLSRKESRSLGFSVIIDARKSATKRKYLEDIVEAMVCFQVCECLLFYLMSSFLFLWI